jgi:hypothetical protein
VPLTHFVHTVEQKKFLACGPEFSVEFSAPPKFSGGVTKKGANLRPSDLEADILPLRHCLLVVSILWHAPDSAYTLLA